VEDGQPPARKNKPHDVAKRALEQEVRAAQELERARHEAAEEEARTAQELQKARREATEQAKQDAILAARRAGRKAKKRRSK
jgi:hypothetical protein